LLLTLVTAYPASVSHETTPRDKPRISTTSGQVIGHQAPWPKDSDIDDYLGIPYAAPPIKELRYMAPKPYHANGTIKADDFVSNLV
jgi:carboxylesterase type B